MARKTYTKEFKREVMEMSHSTSTSQGQFAQDMGIGASSIVD